MRVALLSLGCILLASNGYLAKGSGQTTRDSDEAVIEAVLLAFYEKFEGRFSEWEKGDFIVLRPNRSSEKRFDFEAHLDKIIAHDVLYAKHNAKLDALKISLSTELAEGPNEVIPIGKMKLDNRIVVTNDVIDWRKKEPTIRNRAGELGTIRMVVSIGVPSYSRDGRHAFLGMSPEQPRSGGSGVLGYYAMFLKLDVKGWKPDFAIWSHPH